MMEFDTEEDERLTIELAYRIAEMCVGYRIEQVASATFSIALGAINENCVISERQEVLLHMMRLISAEHNKTITITRRSSGTRIH